MVCYKLEQLNNSVCLKIKNCHRSGCGLVFVGGLGLIMFLMPILTIIFLSIEITFGTVLVCILAWLISGYFIRLYLWNKYGEEIFIIKDNTLETYYDYKFFKDNRKLYHFTKIGILFFIGENVVYVNKLK
jgi:hypothetical protein